MLEEYGSEVCPGCGKRTVVYTDAGVFTPLARHDGQVATYYGMDTDLRVVRLVRLETHCCEELDAVISLVPCPRCGAKRGYRCRNLLAQWSQYGQPHGERIKRWRQV